MSKHNLVMDKVPLSNSTMKDHFMIQWRKLISFDKIRLHKLAFNAQYSVLYVAAGMLVGSTLEHFFPKYDPEKTNEEMIKEILLQTVVFSILLFYTRKLVKLCPYLFNFDESFSQSHAQRGPEYNGYVILALVFMCTQMSYLKKIQHVSKNYITKKINKITNKEPEDFEEYENYDEEVEQEESIQQNNEPTLNMEHYNTQPIDTSLLYRQQQEQQEQTLEVNMNPQDNQIPTEVSEPFAANFNGNGFSYL